MHRYFIKTPWWLKKIFPNYIWNFSQKEAAVYLTFDDGPHPEITTWVMDELKKYNAHATFFCIGKNVERHRSIYERIVEEGHGVGNHTYNHLNAWKASPQQYERDIKEAAAFITSSLFRPPYGRIRSSNVEGIRKTLGDEAQIIMWDVLSADFDNSFTPEQCLQHVLKNSVPGSVIVFHDSEKAYKNLRYALPLVLENFEKRGYTFKKIMHKMNREVFK
ncbi:MAG: polysaccharide deacetylase family protein [Bacteroidota bacterium]|jgi:peptidoglycan/xylan/chitin deacetylase (PgdA/CDA1 family)|nr:polysaccharide deacetylase family protein [Bacteroidota bacterium]